MAKYTISGLKTFRGMEGVGFNVNLLEDGKKVAFVMDAAQGAAFDWEWTSAKAAMRFKAYVDALPAEVLTEPQSIQLWGPTRKREMDDVLNELVATEEERRNLRRLCKKKTVFTLDDGKTYTMNRPYSDVIGARLLAQYGHRLGKIYNTEPEFAGVRA